jgi:hypothetical protein
MMAGTPHPTIPGCTVRYFPNCREIKTEHGYVFASLASKTLAVRFETTDRDDAETVIAMIINTAAWLAAQTGETP